MTKVQDTGYSVQNKTFFPLIQVWRAWAAILVTYGHVLHETYRMAESTETAFEYIHYPTAIGVDIFFVISGFVIVYASRHLYGVSGAWKEFFMRRVVRIVPLYWLYTTLMIIALFLMPQAFDTAQVNLSHFLQSYLFIPHISPAGDIRPALSLGWSLNYEMYFYIVFAVLLCLPFRNLIRALSVYLIVTVIIGMVLPFNITVFMFWFDPYVLEFLAGALIGTAYLENKRLPRSWFLPTLIAAGIVFVSMVMLPEVQDQTVYHAWRLVGGGIMGILLVAAGSLFEQSVGDNPTKLMSLFTKLGDSSYTLYLAHPFMIAVMKILWAFAGLEGQNLWVFAIVTVLVCVIGGYVLYLTIERPLLMAGRLLTKRLVG